jgi:RND family efflux transporter MFP subunit
MSKYWWLFVLPLALLLWWAFGRGESSVLVHFSPVRRGVLASSVPTNGKVEPAEWSAATAETSGVVRTVDVRLGQNVNAGQTIVTLDTTGVRADLAAALARLEQEQTTVKTLALGGKASTVADLNDRIRTAQAAVDAAQRIYDSDQRLLRQQAATELQVNTDRDTLQRAKLNLAALQNQKSTAVTGSDRSLAEARVRDAQAAVALARHRVDLGRIAAPISGTIYQFDLKVGAYLTPGYLVALVGKIDQVKVIVYVDEPDLGRVGLGMPVTITSDSRPGQKWSGKVDKLPTQIVPLQSRSVGQVSTIIDNPQHDLLPGVSVDVRIISKVVNDALEAPKAALRRVENAEGIYKLNGHIINWTPVKSGISDVNNVQILSGLQEGDNVADRIIDPPDAEIRDGMKVKPVFH